MRRHPPILAALAAAALLGGGAPGAPLAAQSSTIVQTDDGPCDLALPPPKAAAGLGAQEGELLPSVEVPEPAEARLARLKASALYDAPPETWMDPPEIKGAKEIDTTLRVAYRKHTVNGKPVTLRSYVLADGTSTIPAPTFRFSDLGPVNGRHLKVKLKNELPCNGGKPGDPTCKPAKCVFHDHEHPDPNNPANFRLNDTNLHVHGLHVSPQPPQDDVLLTVEPGCDYAVDVFIKDHPPGTHWYHPHQHGSTALQLASGMAGAIVIEGGVDNLPEVKAAKERVFVFQQISFDPATGLNEDFRKLDKNWNATKITLVNGQVKPRIVMPRRAVERWRFVNAGFFEVLPVRLAGDAAPAGVPLHVLAVDGITLPRRRPLERVDLAPGNRADVMVQFDQPGTYYVYKSESMRQSGVLDTAQILAQVDVLPDTKEMKLPDVLPGSPKPIDETAAKPRQPLYFSVRFDDKLKRPRFIVNGRDFDPMRVDQTLRRGDTEEWTVFNCTDQDHPYHIHVNAFQVSEYSTPDGQTVRISDPQQRPWHDTFLIPKGRKVMKDGKEVIIPGHFKLLTTYENYIGRFVLHCHILTHEDQGMMQLVDIVP